MNRVRPIAAAFLAAFLAAACSSTVTLKRPSGHTGAVVASGDPAGNAGVAAGGTQPVDPNRGTAPPVAAVPAPPLPAPAGPAPRVPTASRPKPPVTLHDRLVSGLHTGTIGAAFGGLGGPIGMAAGGGGGFLAGFVAGQPLFGAVPPGNRQSWEQQIGAQQDWENQIVGQVQALDGGLPPPAAGISTAPPPGAGSGADLPPPAGVGIPGPRAGPVAPTPADPVADYEAWSQQILTHAQTAATPNRSLEAAASPGSGAPLAQGTDGADRAQAFPDAASSEERRIETLDVNDDGRPDAWFEYEGEVLRIHAMDRDGDGRPDREDVYEQGRVTARLLDEDGDGRFERRDTIRDGQVTARMIDRDGDGRYETLDLSGPLQGPDGVGELLPGEAP
jgi:hypothetical protein